MLAFRASLHILWAAQDPGEGNVGRALEINLLKPISSRLLQNILVAKRIAIGSVVAAVPSLEIFPAEVQSEDFVIFEKQSL